ncbi:hypothetical protein D3C85_290770 [compost metagenome]
MGVDHAGNGDHLCGIDHFGAVGLQILADGGNDAIGNQDVAFGDIADIAIHADDGGVFDQHLVRGWCQRSQQ